MIPKKYLPYFSVLLFLSFSSLLFAQGTNAGNILIQSLSAKAQGMGETYTALSSEQGDITGLQYNPASIGSLQKRELSMTLKGGTFGDKIVVLCYGTPSTLGKVAGTFVYYSMGDTEYLDGASVLKTVNAEKDISFMLSYSKPLSSGFTIGTNVKVIQSELAESYSASAFAADAGLLLKLGKNVAMGLSMQNLGSKLKYDKSSEELPLTFRWGFSHEGKWASFHKTLAGIDVIKRRDEPIRENLGVEYQFDDGKVAMALRMGYRFNEDSGKLNMGLGFPYKQYQFDYSMQVMGDIGNSHFITVGVHF